MRISMLVLALALLPAPASAQRARAPADATVFIRLIGSVHAEFDDGGIKQTADLERVEIGTGSGFTISPFGYVLTNAHVVETGEPLHLAKGLRKAVLTFKVSTVNVCFGSEAVAALGRSTACSEASVTAVDPEADLAVLYVGGSSNLPYLALGDSDVAAAGLPVEALGYPFGREVEIGKVTAAPDLVPEVSTTPGAIAALRTNDAGERRFLQITNSVNPGNSGGPLINRDGFAVGVIRSRHTQAANIAFAIPINEVKNFLELHGLDQLMPSRRLRLGVMQAIENKGVGLRLPEGFADRSPFMTRVDAQADGGEVAFRLDRVVSPWPPKRLEEALVTNRLFEQVAMTPRQDVAGVRAPSPSTLLGGAAGTAGTAADSSRELRMDYAVLDLGSEKLVARYVGPAEAMAFNEGVLRESLLGLQGERFTAAPLPPVEKLSWSTVADGAGKSVLPVPSGWVLEPGSPSPCTGLLAPGMVASAFAGHNTSVVMRAAVWPAGVVPETAAAGCASRRGTLGAASYAASAVWLGVSYVIDGTFTRLRSGEVAQFEVLATEAQAAFGRSLLAAWLAKAAE